MTDHRRACLIDAFKEIDNYRNNLELKKHESLQEDIIDLHLILASKMRLSIMTIGPKAVWRLIREQNMCCGFWCLQFMLYVYWP